MWAVTRFTTCHLGGVKSCVVRFAASEQKVCKMKTNEFSPNQWPLNEYTQEVVQRRAREICEYTDSCWRNSDPFKQWSGKEPNPDKQPSTSKEAWLFVSVILSDRNTGPTTLARVRQFISMAWEFNTNPLPGLRKRMKAWGWTCSTRCWATEPSREDDEDSDNQWAKLPHVSVGASTITFHPIDQDVALELARK
jgi:hypothetical protein